MANFFTDRVVEHPGRVTLTATGGSDEYDVDRAEGTVTTVGTPFNAQTFNGMLDQYGAWYGNCTTAANTAAKEVTCPGFTLVTGSTIAVHFAYGSEYDGQITLNVNSTGAKNVVDAGQYTAGQLRCAWDDDQVIFFVYDGTSWEMVSGPIITDSELDAIESALGLDTYIGRLYEILNSLSNFRLSFACGTCTTAAATTAKVVTVPGSFALVDGGLLSVKFTNSIPQGATMNVADTGAKTVKFCGSNMIDTLAFGGATVLFVYKASDDTWNVLSVDQAQTLVRSSSAWVGTDQYSGHYFADATITIPDGYVPVSTMVYSVTNNHYAYVTYIFGNTFRVWTREPNLTVYFRATLRRTS